MRNRTLTHRRTHSRRAKLLIAVGAVGLAAMLSGLAVAGSSAVSIPRVGSNVNIPADKAAPLADRMPSAANDTTSSAAAAVAASALTAEPIPAAILGANVPVPISSAVLTETNGWLVSDGDSLVAVYAGSKADDSSQGRVVIVRQDLGAATQTVQIVDAGSTGSLAIAASTPSGAAVETSAQTGSLTLNTAHGATVKLNLSTSAISTK